MTRTTVLVPGTDLIGECGLIQLQELGWEVHTYTTAADARRLARRLRPVLVMLDQGQTEESGWLTCVKLRRERPGQRVILLSNRPSLQDRRLASFVGAEAVIQQEAALDFLLEESSACELLSASA